MKSVLIRDVPDDVHAALRSRAEREGKSLQQYLVEELRRVASRPTLSEVLDRIERERAGGRVGFDTAVDDLESGRR